MADAVKKGRSKWAGSLYRLDPYRIILLDSNTDIWYELTITDGKLTMTEVTE